MTATTAKTIMSRKLTAAQRNQVTPFQSQVYEALLQVPPGKVTTYKRISERIQCKSSQAIGQALKRNPFAPQVPCHRVVKANLTIGGFGGHTQGAKIDKKILMLEQEGVRFVRSTKKDKQLIVDPQCVYRF